MISPKKLKAFRDKTMVRRKIAGRWLRLRFSGHQVKVHQFGTDAPLYAEGAWIFLQWHVEHAWSLQISGVGRIHPPGRVRIKAVLGMREITLTAYGPGGSITQTARFTVRPRHEFVAEGTPNAAQAWPPREGFAVPSSLRHLMQPNRQPKMHLAGSAARFQPAAVPAHGPWRHSPPASLASAVFYEAAISDLQQTLSRIRNAQSLSEFNALKHAIEEGNSNPSPTDLNPTFHTP